MGTLRSHGCTSDVRMNRGPASKHLENAVSKFEERRCNMVQRQQFLKNKITSMERSIPALMAYNMWVSGKKCTDAPLCKVKEIMATFSPTPDPTDRLLENLKNKVHVLNRETEELHGEIIDTEIELEERGMELDSLESANNELTERITDLEQQVEKTKVPSLHSIHSEDLVCLAKIRQLGHEEVNLKSCIRELEEKEVKFRQQMEQLLTSREFQKDSGGKKMVKRIQELEATEKKMNCALQTHKYNMHQLKKKLMQKEKEITRMEAFLGVDGELKDSKHIHKRKKDDKQSSKRGSRGSWLPEWMLPSCSTAPGSTTTPEISTETSPSSPSFTADIHGKLKRCVCPTPASVPCYEKPPCRSDNSKPRSCCNTVSSATHCPLPPCPATPCSPLPCPTPLRDTSGGTLPSCCKPPSCPPPPSCQPVCCPSPPNLSLPCKLPSNSQTSSTRCTNNALCKPPECLESPEFRKQDLPCPYAYCCKSRRSSCQPDTCSPPAPCEIGSPCHTCSSSTPCRECVSLSESGGCRCSCKGKCARGESSVPCNCSMIPTCSADKGYQPKGLPKPPCGGATGCWLEEDSDDDFCACCNCGCNESDDSDQ